MPEKFLTTAELAKIIKYDPRTIRDRLKDSVLLEGIHYIRPFGGRKILFIWEAIEKDIMKFSCQKVSVPMANGGACHGYLLYSLIETANANKVEPYAYLRHIFTELPGAIILEDYDALLPWNLTTEKITLP